MASFLTGMLGLDSGKATSKAAGQNVDYLAGLIRRGTNYINTGEQKSGDYLTQAAGQFQPWQQTGTAANSMVANALGLNGAEGNAAATGAFQTSPGYDFNLNQQLQAAERGAAAGGMTASGNLLTALQDRASGVANQEYGNWLDRLIGQSGQGLQAAGGTAGGLTNLAGLYQDTNRQRLGLDASVVQGLMGLTNQYAAGQEAQSQGLANLGSGLGSLFANSKFGSSLFGGFL